MNGQQYRYRSRRKTTTGRGDCVVLIMRTFGTGERVVSATKACSYLLSSILSVRFITANLTMIGDERSSFVIA